MYFSAYQSRKRERSPPTEFATPYNSPALGVITSPTLDVLAKRQRFERFGGVLDQMNVPGPSVPPLHYDSGSSHVINVSNNGNGHDETNGHEHELDMSTQYAEKRRARQWEQLNAPQPTSPLFKTPSEPPPGVRDRINSDLSDQDLGYFASPATHHPPKQSRPQFKHHMSSSPIRHQPPGSSPFKSSGSSSQVTARDYRSSGIRPEEEDEEEGMDQEELRRDWGEHYARPNGLLLSLVSY